jgi:Co/Zn/Cd efflux system component
MVLLLALVLVRDTGAILLDMNPDRALSARIAALVESAGDRVSDLHVWRLGPGHLGAIVGVRTRLGRPAAFYHALLSPLGAISHLTVEVHEEGSVLF